MILVRTARGLFGSRGNATGRRRGRDRWLGTTALVAAHAVAVPAAAQTVTVASGTTRSSSGSTAGVALTAPGAVLDNSGTVTTATVTEAVAVTSGATTATINNKTGGTISGTGSNASAITVQSASTTLTLNNASGATITGVGKAGKFFGTTNITNGGTINAAQGMDFSNFGGSIVNQAGGIITTTNSGNSAIYASSVANGLSITNSGTISVTGRYGIEIVGTGNGAATIVNNGTMSGGVLAMSLSGANDTVTLNSASTTKGALLGDGNDTLTIVAGASITGDLDGSGGTDMLALQGASGSTSIANRISNFEAITKVGASSFRLGNLDATAATVAVDGGTLTLAGNPADWTGATSIASGATLAYDMTTNATLAATVTGAGNFTKLGSNVLTLGAGAQWTGVTTVSAGTLTGTTATLIGLGIVDNATLAYVQATGGTVDRQISGTGVVTVSGLAANAAVTFDAAVTAAQGIRAGTDGRVAIGSSGSVDTSGNYAAITLTQSGAGLTNAGSVTTTSSVATPTVRTAVAATITNAGLIKLSGDGGGRTIESAAALTIVNESGGRIVNDGTNIDPEDPSGIFTGAQLYLTNLGLITATGNGVVVYRSDNPATRMEMAGTIANSGTITAGNAGIFVRAIADITNVGTVTGVNFGVRLDLEMEQGSVLQNGDATHGGALIEATDYYGLGAYSAGALSVDNYGTIRGGGFGLQFDGGGTLTNRVGAVVESVNSYGIYSAYIGMDVQNGGTIRGANHALGFHAGGNLTNSGTIVSSGGDGVRFEGAEITLANSGTITGFQAGVHAAVGATLTNNNGGRIENTDATGGFGAIHLDGGAGMLTFVNDAGATISGAAKAARFYDQADLDNSGTITSQQGIDFFDVGGSVTNRAGGVIESLNAGNSSIFGYNVTGGLTVTNSGTIRSANIAVETNVDSAAATIVNSGTITGGRGTAIRLGNAADTVTLTDGAAITGAIALGGGDDALTVDTGSAATPLGITITGNLDGGTNGTDALTFTGSAGTTTLAGSIANFETITKTGTGTLRLTGGTLGGATIAAKGGTIAFLNSSGSNRINVSATTTLVAETAGAFGSGELHLIRGLLRYLASGTFGNALFLEATSNGLPTATATLLADSGVTATLSGAITRDAGAAAQPLIIGGTGTILLTGTGNSWGGTTTINAGATLSGAAASISGSSIANSGTLLFDQASEGSFGIAIGGGGTLTKLGAGNLTLRGTGSWTGRTTVSAGTLTGTTTSLSSTSPISVNTTLAYVQNDSGTASNAIDGTGVVTVSGLSSGNAVSFAGTVTVAGGIAGGTNGRIAIANGGSVSTTANAAILLNGSGASLTNGGTIGSTRTEAVRITAPGGSVVNTTGHGIASSGSVGVFASGANASLDNSGSITGAVGSYGVQYYTGGAVTNQAGGSITGGVAIGGYGAFTIVNAGTLTATNAGPYKAAINIMGGADSVTLAAGSTTNGFVELWHGDDQLTLVAGSGASTQTIVAGYVSGGDGTDALSFDGSGTGTLSGDIRTFETITKSGTGAWTIRNAAEISSGVTVTAGTLILDTTTDLTNTFTVDGGTLRAATAGALGGGVIHATDAVLQYGATGDYANAISLDRVGATGATTIVVDSGKSATLTGAIASGTGNAAQSVTIASGTVILGNTGNSWSGTTTIASAATLRGSATTLSGGAVANDGTLVIAQDSDDSMSAPISGSGDVTKSGSGALTLTGAGSWSGVTTVSSGSLIGSSASIGGASIVNASQLTFAQDSDGTTNAAISGSGSMTKSGTGNLTLAGAGSWTGTTAIQGGTLTGTSLTIAGASIVNDAALVYDQAIDGSAGQSITGTGSLTKTGSGALTLSGQTGYDGETRVIGGTLRLGHDDMLADAAAVTVTGATLDVQSYSDTVGSLSLSGTLQGTGRLTAATYDLNGASVNAQLGTGTITQSGGVSVLNGYTLAQVVDIAGGTLRLGASDVLSDTAILTVEAGATLDLQNFSDTVGSFTILGTLTGTGTLTADAYHLAGGTADLALGAGRMYVDAGLNLLNATSAATTVAIGDATLRLGAADRLSDNADVTVAAAGTLDLQSYSDTVRSVTIAGAITGTGTLTAAEYTLQDAVVNASLGQGTLVQASGTSTLVGASAAGVVSLTGGTLTLGGNDRLAAGATISVASGATLELNGYSQTVSGRVDNAGTIQSGTLALADGTLVTRAGAATRSVTSTGNSSIVTASGGSLTTVAVTGGSATIDHYGTLAAASATTGNVDLRLYAGSTTGSVQLGGGDDTLALFTGVIDAGLVTSGAATLRAAGSYDAAQVGAIDLGGGTNGLDLRGDLTGVLAAGAVGITTLTKYDLGRWTVTDLTATIVNAGIGTAGAGMLTLAGTGSIGDIVVNGATLTLASTTAAGSATLHMVDPTVNFAATGVYANGIDLAVTPANASADPSILNNASAGAIMLSGAITESIAGQNVAFTGAGTTTLSGANAWSGATTIASGTVLIGTTRSIGGSVIGNAGTLTYDQSFDGTARQAIGGTGTLVKAGTGTVSLAAANGFTGAAIINAGRLRLADAGALANAASLTLTGVGATLIVDTAGQATVNALSGGVGTAIALLNGGLTLVTQADRTFAGILSGGASGGIEKAGTGTLTLSGANILTAGVTAQEGTLALAGDGTLATASGVTLAASGATLDISQVSPDTASIQSLGGVSGSVVSIGGKGLIVGGGTFAGTISGNGGLTKIGGGTLTLSGPNAYGGATQVQGGSLVLADATVIPVTSALSVAAGARLMLAGGSMTVGTLVSSGTIDGTATLTASATSANGANYTLQGGIVNADLGTGSLQAELGTTLLAGRSAATTVTVASGTLRLGAADRLADTAALAIGSGGTLDLQSYSDTVANVVLAGALVGTGMLTAASYTLDSATVGAQLGTGTLIQVRGASTLSGATAAEQVVIAGGTLRLAASDILADTATLTVQSGAALDLQGNSDRVGSAIIAGQLVGSGTLAASRYMLDSAMIGANLGAGALTQRSGVSTLSGQSGAAVVTIAGGTLRLGAADRLADSAVLTIAAGGTLDLTAFDDTLGSVLIAGAMTGSGTLTASNYTLTAATVNANLGTGSLIQASGVSTLAGASAANIVAVNGGTLRLAASDRLADTATVYIAAGATLDLQSASDTVGSVAIAGTLTGTATLTAGAYVLDGGSVTANLGAGTFVQRSGMSTLGGVSGAGVVTIAGGTLQLGAGDRLSDTAVLTIGTGATFNLAAFSDTVAMAVIGGALTGSGTLTAANYLLDGAGVTANLGSGTLLQRSGVSTLGGVSGASVVTIAGGTLQLGAGDRLADNAALTIGVGATFDLASYGDTVGSAIIAGSVTGRGTLTAGQYGLSGATISANLGSGTLVQRDGVSTLSGTAGASLVAVMGGTLRLGGDERLANGAVVIVDAGATLDASERIEHIAAIGNGGSGGGTIATGSGGRLILGGTNADFAFGGRFVGTGDVDKIGAGTFAFTTVPGSTTARLNVLDGTLQLGGQSDGAVRVAGGSLSGAGRIGGALTVEAGSVSPGTRAQPLGQFQADRFDIGGGGLTFDVAGAAGGYASDLIRVAGAATLGGGTVTIRAVATGADDQVARFYTVLQAGSVTGAFSNGATLSAVSDDATLQWRLRYDLVPNAVLVEVRKQVDLVASIASDATFNQRSIGAALGGTGFTASDAYAAMLNRIASGSVAERTATFDSLSGEAIGSGPLTSAAAATGFVGLLQQRIANQGSFAATGAAIGSQTDGRMNAIAKLRAVSPASGVSGFAEGSIAPGLSAWFVGYGADATIAGRGGTASSRQFNTGQGLGIELRTGAFSLGMAGSVNQIETKVRARLSRSDGTLYQFGVYGGYDDGRSYASLTASFFAGDIGSERSVFVNGNLLGRAVGSAGSRGYTLGVGAGRRIALGGGFALTPQIDGGLTTVVRDAFVERGAGVLSLAVGQDRRDLYQVRSQFRLSHRTAMPGGWAEPFVSVGARGNLGERDANSAMRFSGAPIGAGNFTARGSALPRAVGLLGSGFEARVADWALLGLRADHSLSTRMQESRINLSARIVF